jgi:hypothetical protein
MNGLFSSVALAAFAESLVEGRRVVVFGSALSPTPRLLLERGARLVHVCDPAPLRVAEALRRPSVPGLTLSSLSDDEVAAREGAVDCVFVEHLGAFDARAIVEKARSLLAVRGVALFVTPNRDARRPLLPPSEPAAAPLDYYALYDLVKAQFEYVRMLGQAPFVGYAVVDFAPDGEPEPVVDSDFVPRGSEEPELFIAVAARHRPNVPGHALVQVPLESVLAPTAPAERPLRPERSAPPPELVKKVEQQEAWIRELEGRAAVADERADAAEDELEALREKLAHDEGAVSRQAAEQAESLALSRLAELTADVERERNEKEAARRERDAFATRIRDLEAELDEKNGELLAATTELTAKTAELAALGADVGAEQTGELAALEERLTERGQEVRRLERELAEAERIGKELIAEVRSGAAQAIDGAGAPPNNATAASEEELDALAVRLATAEADREALSWVVTIRGPTS